MKFFKKISLKELITYSFWLKVLSLIIAIVVWLYMSGKITHGIKI